MRFFLTLISSIVLQASSLAQEKATVDSSYANKYYNHRVALFRQLPDEKGEIIFLGNSLTEAGEWQELTGLSKVKNRGISGDVTYGILARLDEVLSSKPAKIFLLSGTNDLKRGIPVDTLAKTFERLVVRIKTLSPKTKLYLQSMFPVNEGMTGESYKKITNVLVRQLNEKLKTVAQRYNAVYVDLYPVLADGKGQLKKEYTTDGIHLWPDAYTVWVNYLKEQKCL